MSVVELSLLGFLLFTAAAGVIDYRTAHIPNKLVLGGALVGISMQVAMRLLGPRGPNFTWQGALLDAARDAGVGLALCAVVPLLLYRVSAMGGGDVKLLAAVGIWGGVLVGVNTELYAFLVAMLFALARLAYRGRLLSSVWNSLTLLVNPILPKQRRRLVPREILTEVRFAPAVFAGALLTVVLHGGRL